MNHRSSLNRILSASFLSVALVSCSGGEAEIPVQRRCVVEVNGEIVKVLEADNRNDCYAKISFGSRNCEIYAEHFEVGDNQLRQIFGSSSVLNKQTCTVLDD